uniref:Uncharacterized protein n=1 Tax=Arundo donax TaxID=35708 RepID=A0A0A9HVG4_ARUDO
MLCLKQQNRLLAGLFPILYLSLAFQIKHLTPKQLVFNLVLRSLRHIHLGRD